MQVAVGLICVAFGMMHFMARDRGPEQEARSYYLNTFVPRSSTARAALAVVEVSVGFALLFTA